MNVLHTDMSRSIQEGLLERLSTHYGVDLDEVLQKVPPICLGGSMEGTAKKVYEITYEGKTYYVDE